MDETKAEVKSGLWDVITFLERAEIVFNYAIATTSTSPFRNQFTDLNMERMALIRDKEDINRFAKRLRDLLYRLVANEEARDEMSCDDTCFGDTTDARNELVRELVKIMKT